MINFYLQKMKSLYFFLICFVVLWNNNISSSINLLPKNQNEENFDEAKQRELEESNNYLVVHFKAQSSYNSGFQNSEKDCRNGIEKIIINN